MDEQAWLNNTDPQGMLHHLRTWGRASDRKLRLLCMTIEKCSAVPIEKCSAVR